MNTTHDDARRRIVASARHLSSRLLSPGSSGNLSIRVGDDVIVTPTGSSLSRVSEADLAEVSLDGVVRGHAKPSKEAGFHRAAYAADARLRAIVHLHSPAATAVACLPGMDDGLAALPAYTPYRVMSLGDVPLLPYAAPGEAALASHVGTAVKAGYRVMLMAQHGSLVVAESLDRAVDLAEELEASAQVALTLATLSGRTLTPAQQQELRERSTTGK